MTMKVFISSEMSSPQDCERREAAIEEIKELGHDPIFFEGLPGRPLSEGQDMENKLREIVRDSNILLAIVDDTVSEGMDIELDEAISSLGEKRIFYFFTKDPKRGPFARKLWLTAKNGCILKEFETPLELRKEIRKSFASYMEDNLKKKRKVSRILLNKEIVVTSDQDWRQLFRLNSGDVVAITCEGSSKFLAELVSMRQFRLRNAMSRFEFHPSQETQLYSDRKEIIHDDDYCLVITGVGLSCISVNIRVEVRRERYE